MKSRREGDKLHFRIYAADRELAGSWVFLFASYLNDKLRPQSHMYSQAPRREASILFPNSIDGFPYYRCHAITRAGWQQAIWQVRLIRIDIGLTSWFGKIGRNLGDLVGHRHM